MGCFDMLTEDDETAAKESKTYEEKDIDSILTQDTREVNLEGDAPQVRVKM
jgi:hypothetical protein